MLFRLLSYTLVTTLQSGPWHAWLYARAGVSANSANMHLISTFCLSIVYYFLRSSFVLPLSVLAKHSTGFLLSVHIVVPDLAMAEPATGALTAGKPITVLPRSLQPAPVAASKDSSDGYEPLPSVDTASEDGDSMRSKIDHAFERSNFGDSKPSTRSPESEDLEEKGRTYHRQGKYYLPNDEASPSRLIVPQHTHRFTA